MDVATELEREHQAQILEKCKLVLAAIQGDTTRFHVPGETISRSSSTETKIDTFLPEYIHHVSFPFGTFEWDVAANNEIIRRTVKLLQIYYPYQKRMESINMDKRTALQENLTSPNLDLSESGFSTELLKVLSKRLPRFVYLYDFEPNHYFIMNDGHGIFAIVDFHLGISKHAAGGLIERIIAYRNHFSQANRENPEVIATIAIALTKENICFASTIDEKLAVEIWNLHGDRVPSTILVIRPSTRTWTMTLLKWFTLAFLFILIVYILCQHQITELYRYFNEERQRKLHEEITRQKVLEARRQFEEAKKGIYLFTIFFSSIYLCFKQPLALIVIVILLLKLYYEYYGS